MAYRKKAKDNEVDNADLNSRTMSEERLMLSQLVRNPERVLRFQKIVDSLPDKQIKIAQKINATRQYLSNVYHGKDKFSESKMLEFARVYNINLNYFYLGIGDVFLNQKEINESSLDELKRKFHLSMENTMDLLDLLSDPTTKEMVLKFIEVKHGSDEAIDSLIDNLKGIKAQKIFSKPPVKKEGLSKKTSKKLV